jgi:hypothetical protein
VYIIGRSLKYIKKSTPKECPLIAFIGTHTPIFIKIPNYMEE